MKQDEDHCFHPQSSVFQQLTVDPKFLAALDERGQGIPNNGDKRRGRKGYQCDQNYSLTER